MCFQLWIKKKVCHGNMLSYCMAASLKIGFALHVSKRDHPLLKIRTQPTECSGKRGLILINQVNVPSSTSINTGK